MSSTHGSRAQTGVPFMPRVGVRAVLASLRADLSALWPERSFGGLGACCTGLPARTSKQQE
jgi:hypothetical protein